MSKTKTTGTTHYEILFIIPNKFTEDEAKEIISEIEKTITASQGSITLREYWGKKRLAYEIKHNTFGYYGLFEFDLEGASLAKIDSSLRLNTNILRHQIVVKKKKSAEEIAKNDKIKAKIDSKKAEAEKKELAKKVSSSSLKNVSDNKKSESTTSKKTELKDLDKKLEGILNAKDLI